MPIDDDDSGLQFTLRSMWNLSNRPESDSAELKDQSISSIFHAGTIPVPFNARPMGRRRLDEDIQVGLGFTHR